MTFQPRMQNRISGFSVIGDVHRRNWNGIVADLWDVECAPVAGGYYVADHPRLFIVLDSRVGQNYNLRLSEKENGAPQTSPRKTVSYIPAGMELWAEMLDVQYLRHLDLHFDIDVLSRRLMEEIDPGRSMSLKLLFSDPAILGLAEMIAAECANPQPLHDLYGDGLAVALFVRLLDLGASRTRKRSKLAAWQLNRSKAYIEENCLRGIRLKELAELTGLSESYFSHAFKASTGLPPHQWQMNARIERAKTLIRRDRAPLNTVAAETGFADQAHFTRVFRKTVGMTPAMWKKTLDM